MSAALLIPCLVAIVAPINVFALVAYIRESTRNGKAQS